MAVVHEVVDERGRVIKTERLEGKRRLISIVPQEPPQSPRNARPATPPDTWYGYPGPAYPPANGEPIRVLFCTRVARGGDQETFASYLAKGMPSNTVEWYFIVEEGNPATDATEMCKHGGVRFLPQDDEWWAFLRVVLDFRPHIVHTDSDRCARFAARAGLPCIHMEADGNQAVENYLVRYHKVMWPVTDIVILAHNELEVTRSCVAQVIANTWAPYRLILVDNGSTEPVGKFFYSVRQMLGDDRCLVLESDKNLGCPGGRQLAYDHTTSKYFAWIDNDMLTPPGWLGPLVQRMHTDARIGAIAPWTDIYWPSLRGQPAKPFDITGSNNLFRMEAVRNAEEEPGQLHPEPFRSLQGQSDRDLLWRIKEAGYTLWIDGTVQLRHLGGPLHGDMPQGLTRRVGDTDGMRRADAAFARKWTKAGIRRVKAPSPKRNVPRILFFVPNAWWGGLHNWTNYLVKYLPRNEFDVHFLIRRVRQGADEALREYGVVHRITPNTEEELPEAIREVLSETKPDVVQANTVEMACVAHDMGILCVTTGHSMLGAKANGAEFADCVFRVSPAIPGDQPMILNGVDAPPVRDRVDHLITYLGRLDHDRNPQVFFNALNVLWRRRQDFRVRIIGANMDGSFDPKQFPWVDGLKERVELSGLVPHTKALELVAEADVVTAPWPEGFGLGVAEGMRGGAIPVVSTGGFGPGLVGEYGVTVGSEPEKIADGLSQALDNTELRGKRTTMKEWAGQRYDAKRFSAEYAKVYRELTR